MGEGVGVHRLELCGVFRLDRRFHRDAECHQLPGDSRHVLRRGVGVRQSPDWDSADCQKRYGKGPAGDHDRLRSCDEVLRSSYPARRAGPAAILFRWRIRGHRLGYLMFRRNVGAIQSLCPFEMFQRREIELLGLG